MMIHIISNVVIRWNNYNCNMEWLLIDPSQQIPANRQWGKNTAPPTCWRPPECRHQTSPRASPSRLSWLCMQLCEHEYIVLVYIYIYITCIYMIYIYIYIYIYTPYIIYIHTYVHASIYLHYIPFHSIPLHYITLHIYNTHMHLYVYIYISIYIYYTCINIKGWKLWRHLLGRMIQVWS